MIFIFREVKIWQSLNSFNIIHQYSYLFIGRSEQMSEEEVYAGNQIDFGSFENKLQKVAAEIDQLKDSFSKSTEDLSRIKNMLDIDTFKDITSTIEKFEGQLSEANRQKEEAYQGAKKYSQELEKEKERLIKLWDAYKKQEEELSQIETKIQEYEQRATTAENEKQQLETKYADQLKNLQEKLNTTSADMQQLDEYKNKINDYTQKYNSLEQQNQTLQSQTQQYQSTINELQQQVAKYKEYEQYADYKDKYNEVNSAYEKEKDRLTKLYHLYEETEQEVKKLQQENAGWQSWFNSNKEVFDKLFSAAPPVMPNKPKNPFNKPDVNPQPSPQQPPAPQGKTQQPPTQTKTMQKPPEQPKKKKGFFKR